MKPTGGSRSRIRTLGCKELPKPSHSMTTFKINRKEYSDCRKLKHSVARGTEGSYLSVPCWNRPLGNRDQRTGTTVMKLWVTELVVLLLLIKTLIQDQDITRRPPQSRKLITTPARFSRPVSNSQFWCSTFRSPSTFVSDRPIERTSY